ncbi:MAG: hypothetical protein NC218_11090 [Acetobacter sp.]|nr:hypothetical protein [Acetobacter sp.]
MTTSLVCGLPRLLPYGAPRNDGGRRSLDSGSGAGCPRGMTGKGEYRLPRR